MTSPGLNRLGTCPPGIKGTIKDNISITTVTFEYGLTMAYGTSVTTVGCPVTGFTHSAVT